MRWKSHENKTVVFYYDTTALGSNYAVNEQDFHWNVVHEFELRGWRVESVYLGNPMHHHEKYLLINNAFAGKQRLMPFFNRSNNVIAKRFRSIAEKEHCSNTVPTAPTPSIPSLSAAKNTLSTIPLPSQ